MRHLILFIKIFFHSIFRFPATVIHETCHFLLAIATFSKVTSVNIIPRIKYEKNEKGENYVSGITYGSVRSEHTNSISLILTSIAPLLILWPAFAYFVFAQDFISLNALLSANYNQVISWEQINYDKQLLLNAYIAIQLFLGGTLSTQDINNILGSIFSLGFFFTIGVAVLLYIIFTSVSADFIEYSNYLRREYDLSSLDALIEFIKHMIQSIFFS